MKAKNIIFMQNINNVRDKEGHGLQQAYGRTWPGGISPYQYSIASWKHFADKHNCTLFVLEDLIADTEEMGICWQRYYLFDILKQNGIENYDQILIVDADTIVHPDCPNFFEMTEHKYCGVMQDGCLDWVCRSIENYNKFVFDTEPVPFWKYINGGFQIFNKKHKEFFDYVNQVYLENKDSFIYVQKNFGVGTDQTPINYFLQEQNIDMKLLPYEFNMTDLVRKEILDEALTFTKIGWVYHYCAIPNNHNQEATLYWMKKTYEHFYGELNEN